VRSPHLQRNRALAVGRFECGGRIFWWRYPLATPIVSTMAESAAKETFDAVELKDGSGWYVRLTRPAMLPQHIGDFKTEAEAREWIDAKSAEWLVRYGAS
jgi:hypothetical protein